MLKCHEFTITVRKAKRDDMVQVYKMIKVDIHNFSYFYSVERKCLLVFKTRVCKPNLLHVWSVFINEFHWNL